MKTEILWSDRIPERDSARNTVYDIAFKPDGTQVLFACGSRILVYDAEQGSLLHSLKGHKDTVYCVAYSKDGKRFASGSADKNIIIWTTKCEGILKYSHNDSIQCLAYNPVTQQLASATPTDFGLWSPEQKSVAKYKISAKALCASWTNDGQYLAIGQFNGHISIRDKQGVEKVRIERPQPIWTLSWSPPTSQRNMPAQPAASNKENATSAIANTSDVLAVGCWDQTLSFYQISGQQVGKDTKLDYDPCSLCFYEDGEYLLMGGNDRKVSLYSKEGVFLKQVAEKDDWIWAVRARPKHKHLAVGCNDGAVSLHSTVFSTVHGLFQERYAHRDTMTDVILQHLITEQKVRIKCREYVKKIAVYRDRLAVQLPERVLIYETVNSDPLDMHYRLKEKILKKLDCNLLVVTTDNIILCQEKKLQLFDLKGNKLREWVLDAVIRYIRVVGGPPGKEGLLVGLKSGAVYKIFVDNRFPIQLIKHEAPIRCLDLSASRRKLAVVDENSKIFVYDLLTQQVLFEESNANSVAWNTEMEDMFCYSGNGYLSIKTADFPVHKQSLQGFVVGFKGSKIFCLHFLSMQTIDVPQSASLHRYLERKDFNNAYTIACLGVTDSDWRELAINALLNLNLEVARKAFIRLRDIRFLDLVNRIEVARKSADHDDNLFLAEIYAYQGQYDEAARMYLRAGKSKLAIQMFLDLRDWERAKKLVEQLNAEGGATAEAGENDPNRANVSMAQLVLVQAKWLEELKEYKAAAEMFWAGKNYLHAIELLGDNGLTDELMEKSRSLNKSQRAELEKAAEYFRNKNLGKYALETYLKLEDIKSLVSLYVEQQKWEDAFALATTHPEYAGLIYEPYAEYLASKDMFEEAHAAFVKAGKPQQSIKMLQTLSRNAVDESRFNDAGFYYWLLATETLKRANESHKKEKVDIIPLLEEFAHHLQTSEIYYAFHSICRYTDEPFTSLLPEAIFQLSQFVLNMCTPLSKMGKRGQLTKLSSLGDLMLQSLQKAQGEITPVGVSNMSALFALGKQSKILGAFKLARAVYTALQSYKLPSSWINQVDAAALSVRAQPFTDKEEVLAICYRCSTPNPLLQNCQDRCLNCGHSFVRSFISFEVLPLVEFFIDDDISDEEARRLIEAEVPSNGAGSATKDMNSNVQMLSFDNEEDTAATAVRHDDIFHKQLMSSEPDIETGVVPSIRLNREGLVACPRREVYVRNWGWPVSSDGASPARVPRSLQFFRNVVPGVAIAMCTSCQHFFHEQDYEMHVLQKRSCPFCRTAVGDDF